MVAVIGHSGCGKSSLVHSHYGVDRIPDMDVGLGTDPLPSIEQIIVWLNEMSIARTFVAVSNAEISLDRLGTMNEQAVLIQRCPAIRWVYVRVSPAELKMFLHANDADGNPREPDGVHYTLSQWQSLDAKYLAIADSVRQYRGESIPELLGEILNLSQTHRRAL